MRVRTKRRRTKIKSSKSIKKTPKTVSAKDHVKKAYPELPKWAVYLSGLRYRENLTQKELGEKIGVKQSNISLMERGRRPIGKDMAQRLAKVFDTDYRLFL